MNWQRYATLDPYLCGSLAFAEWEWWQERTAEQEAERVRLIGDRRADFLRGWHDEDKRRAHERKAQLVSEYEQMAAGYERGDPAA